MKLHRFEAPYRGDMIAIEPLGDTHVGSPAFAREHFLERVEKIKRDRNRYWIGMGDYVDNIRPWKRGAVDKRWETSLLEGEADWVTQWEEFVEYVKPIREKCIGVLWGNHEWGSYEEHEFERMVRQDLGVKFLGARAMIYFEVAGKNVVKRDWRVCAVHGDFGGYTEGGALNVITNLATIHTANIYLYAHTHFKAGKKSERITIGLDKGKPVLVREPFVYMLTGGFVDPFYIGADMYYDKKPRGKSIRVGTMTVAIDPVEVKLHVFE